MSDYGSYPPGRGFAWRGDWLERLLDSLRMKGFMSLTSFVQTMPLATFEELVHGWPSDLSWEGQEDVRSALITWQLSLEDEHHDTLLGKMATELLDATDIPPGWLPSGVDDPRLVSLFDRYWPQGG